MLKWIEGTRWFYGEELEKIEEVPEPKYKVGDKVVCIEKTCYHYKIYGTVMGVSPVQIHVNFGTTPNGVWMDLQWMDKIKEDIVKHSLEERIDVLEKRNEFLKESLAKTLIELDISNRRK